ncbi:MAG TPA: hypothetical protein VH877_00910 [Polyangia bacterium]|jgi:tetratricopeptide (TPR) repeat protein|nr:hypothetical protein [Polyangia bacterium]
MNRFAWGSAAVLGLILLSPVTGCAARLRTAKPQAPAQAKSAESGPALTSEDEYTRARSEYDALEIGDPRRAALRERLAQWLLAQVRSHLDVENSEQAFERFQQALTLWDASEISTRTGRLSPLEERLYQAAQAVEQIFRRRGAHEQVLSALAVERSLRPDDAGARERWQLVRSWLLSQGAFEDGARQRLIDDLMTAAATWPARFVIDELATLYLDARDEGRGLGRRGLRGGRLDLSQLRRLQQENIPLAHRLAALYLRVSDLNGAAEAVRKLGGRDEDDEELRNLIAGYAGAQGTPRQAFELAQQMLRTQDLNVSGRICRDATRRFPTAVEPWLCLGTIAEQQGRVLVALRAFEELWRRTPDRREVWEELAKLHEFRLFQLASGSRLDELLTELQRVETFHARARERFPQKPLVPSLAGAYFEVGRGFYNAGRIADALRYCERSLTVEPTAQALEQMALIAVKKGQGREAVTLYLRALTEAADMAPTLQQRYWSAKLHQGLADALELQGDSKASLEARRKSVVDWELLLRGQRAEQERRQGSLGAEDIAEAELERGKQLYLLGQREAALLAFERAVDSAPSRGPTYVDLLAFLVPRGEREEALDTYHRALGRSEVSDDLKVYCSIWMIDLDRRAGEPEDPLAQAFLAGQRGGQWQSWLAQWMIGRITDAELERHADNTPKRAEAAFYRAMRHVERGELEKARALWRQVIDTQMMAFFEYDMASYYLRYGTRRPLPGETMIATPAPPASPDTSQSPKAPNQDALGQ